MEVAKSISEGFATFWDETAAHELDFNVKILRELLRTGYQLRFDLDTVRLES